ncbi:putative cell division control protein [Rhizodiscina lignyota]|uniref:Cell division control protein n=1 Tax=Rhizodiscina lignyota TaxID=1504668 RepID=A0A9P4I6J8_9PEZI|nr:putative cell division control protein [Rhizodiscina lignyota]
MATVDVCTPTKGRLFTTKTAGGRMPLTPSPKTSNYQPTPPSIHSTPTFAQALSRSGVRKSAKSNIARDSPRRLELGLSDWTLTGTGTPSKPRSTQAGVSTATQSSRPRPKSSVRIAYNAADRFIPNRSASEAISNAGTAKLDTTTPKRRPRSAQDGSAVLSSSAATAGLSLNDRTADDEDDDKNYSKPSPNTVAYESSIANACGVSLNTRILAFKPAPPESSKPIDLRSQYNRPLKPANALSAQLRRRILTSPERVLDAPNIVDDYYLNLLDWSCNNQVAIGLGQSVYVWSADSGTVSPLIEDIPETYISSLKWSGDGAYVSVGLGSGEVQIWDVEEGTKLRSMFGHDSRVSAMSWNKHTLTTGSRTGALHSHDVRIAQHHTNTLTAHTGEVCGLEWRQDGAQLASGGNDNLVCIWDSRALNTPKFQKTNHNAAVKALAWCPWQLNLLATGGGSHDRHIHFWNSTSGARVNSIDTGSQVTSLRWSTQYKELASTSGFPDNSISIWSYPSLVKNIEIPAHESRVLHSCLSPDGQTLATAAADESLKFWKVFEKKAGSGSSSAAAGVSKKVDGMAAARTIR